MACGTLKIVNESVPGCTSHQIKQMQESICHLKDCCSSSWNKTSSFPLSLGAEAQDIYMEDEERPAVWCFPFFFFYLQEIALLCKRTASSPTAEQSYDKSVCRRGRLISPLRSCICLREARRESIFLGDSEGIKASWQAHGLEMSPIKKTWTCLTLIGKSRAVTVHALIWETSTITLEIIKILGEWVFWFCLWFPFSHYWQKPHLWIFLF